MQFPLLTAPLLWQGPMHFHYRDSNFTIAIITISILSLSTTQDVLSFCVTALIPLLADSDSRAVQVSHPLLMSASHNS